MRSMLKGSFSQIIFLVAILAAVMLIMVYLKSDLFKFKPSNIPEFEGSIAMVDNRYFNKQHHFGISLPNNDWEFVYYKIDSLKKQNKSVPLLDNLNIMLQMIRRDLGDTLSIIRVGIIELLDPRMAQSLADQCLNELKKSVAPKDSLAVVAGTTLSGIGSNQGAYHVVEFPGRKYSKYPVWVTMFFNYNKLAYVVICQVKSEYYGFLKTDFEAVLKSFRIFKL